MIDPGLALQGATVLVTAGAAFGGVKAALNGTRRRIDEVKESVAKVDTKLDKHVSSDERVQIQMIEGLTRVEVKLDERTGPR